MKMRVRNQSLSVIAGLLFLSACTSEVSKQSIGKIRLAMQWPQASAFSIQTIPENTSHITIRIRGVGLNQPLERSLERQTGATQRLEFVLPTGSKEVRVQALSNDEQVLAEAIDSVEIRSNQTSKIELDMKSLPVPKPIPSSSTANRPSSGGASGGSSGNNTRPPAGDGNLPSAGGPKPLKPDASSPPSLPPLISPPHLPPRPTGGGGGAEPLDLIAAPQIVSGLGYPSEMVFLIPPDKLVGLSVENFTWACQDTGALNQPCNNFSTTAAEPSRAIWTSPAIASGPYRISLDFLPPNRNTPIHKEVLVTVLSGTGSLGASNKIGFDGAVEGF